MIGRAGESRMMEDCSISDFGNWKTRVDIHSRTRVVGGVQVYLFLLCLYVNGFLVL